MNRVELTGNLTKEPKVRTVGKEKQYKIASFTLAVNTKIGEKEEVLFQLCEAWNADAETIESGGKGARFTIEGRLKDESFEGKDGKMVYLKKVIANKVESGGRGRANQNAAEEVGDLSPQSVPVDDIPF